MTHTFVGRIIVYGVAVCVCLACGKSSQSDLPPTHTPQPVDTEILPATPAPQPATPTTQADIDVQVWNILGTTLTPADVGVAKGAPVADQSAVRLADGRVRLYFFAQNKGIMSAISADGIHFTPEEGLRMPDGNGMPRALVLADGSIRLYVISGDGIVSAISSDGLQFTSEPGIRMRNSDAPVPAMSGVSITATDSGYRAYFSDLPRPGEGPKPHRVYSATSTDGLTWTFEAGVRVGAASDTAPDAMQLSAEHPMVIREQDGSYTMYFARNQTIMTSTSADGLLFADAQSTQILGNDPDVLRNDDGSYTLYYGDFDQEIGGFLLVARQTRSTWDVRVQATGPDRFVIDLFGKSVQPVAVSANNDKDYASYDLSAVSSTVPGNIEVTVRRDHPFMPALRVSDGTVTRVVALLPKDPAPRP